MLAYQMSNIHCRCLSIQGPQVRSQLGHCTILYMVRDTMRRMAQIAVVGCAVFMATMATLACVRYQVQPYTDLLLWDRNHHVRAHMVPQSVEGTASFDDTTVLHDPMALHNRSVVWLTGEQYQTLQSGSSVVPFPREGCPQQRGVLLMSGNSAQLCDRGFTLIMSNWHRLGNGLLSIANMLYVAEQTFSSVRFETMDNSVAVLLASNRTDAAIHEFRHKSVDVACRDVAFVDTFFDWHGAQEPYSGCLGFNFIDLSIVKRRQLLQTYLVPQMDIQISKSASDTLVIHIRSEDIFRTHVQTGYVQPPLAFYQKIIQERNYTSVRVVTADHLNPTVDALAAWSDIVSVSEGRLEDDVSLVLGASHLVLATGTFASTLALLAEPAPMLYVPCMPYCAMAATCDEIPFPASCYTFPNFTDGKAWNNSPEQVDLMLTYEMHQIVEVKNNLSLRH